MFAFRSILPKSLFLKIDEYILSEFWLPFVSGAGIITGVWLGIDKLKDIFKLLGKSGASFANGLMILGLEIPQIIAVTIPISILLASFLAFQKLSGQSEIIAFRACGFSFNRIMLPVVYIGLLGASFCFIVNEFVVPITGPTAKRIYMLTLYGKPFPENSVKSVNYTEYGGDGEAKRIFYIESIKNNILSDVIIIDTSDKELMQIYTAKKAYWSAEDGGWTLERGSSSAVSRELDQSKHYISNFDKSFIPGGVDPNKILAKLNHVKEMNFIKLIQYIAEHDKQNIKTNDYNRARNSLQNKFAYPLSAVFLALIGACLGITGRRQIINWGYIVLGLIVFIFYMSQSMFDSLGDAARISPDFAMWIPNIILGSLTYIIYSYRASK